MDLPSLLAEFGRTSADAGELNTFLATLSSSPEMQQAVAAALQAADASVESLPPQLVSLLLKWQRSAAPGQRHLVLQHVPALLLLSLTCRDRRSAAARELDAFLLSLYNQLVSDSAGQPQRQPFRVETLSHSSIYHDGARITDPLDPVGAATAGQHFRQATAVNAQNRQAIAEALLRAFNGILGELSKPALTSYVRTTKAMLQRGHGGGQSQQQQQLRRVQLSPNVLLELLYGVYFCIYNGFQPAGGQTLELIRQRGAALGSSLVLVAVNAVRTLVLNSGPSQLPATSITTPSQIAKNLITNASFRAKKMGDDIPKVAVTVEEATAAAAAASAAAPASASSNAISNNLKVLANMTSISEEIVEEVLAEKTPTKSKDTTKMMTAAKEKLMRPKLPGFKKRSSESESDRERGGSSSSKGGGGGGGGGEGSKKFSELKRKEALLEQQQQQQLRPKLSLSSTSSAPRSPAPSGPASASASASAESPSFNVATNNGGQQLSAPTTTTDLSEIDSMEKIEALIQMKKLPPETVTIHSPESGTTIF